MAKKEIKDSNSIKNAKFVFKASDFRKLLIKQDYKCYVTNRELTPEVTFAEHIIPLRKGGAHRIENICLVHAILYRMKRYHSMDEIVEMSIEIIKMHGNKYGYKIRKSK